MQVFLRVVHCYTERSMIRPQHVDKFRYSILLDTVLCWKQSFARNTVFEYLSFLLLFSERDSLKKPSKSDERYTPHVQITETSIFCTLGPLVWNTNLNSLFSKFIRICQLELKLSNGNGWLLWRQRNNIIWPQNFWGRIKIIYALPNMQDFQIWALLI